MGTAAATPNVADLEAIRVMRRYYAWKAALVRPHAGPRVLEAGCGTGLLLEALGARELRAGIDRDVGCVAIANRRLGRVRGMRFRHLDVLSPAFLRFRAWRPTSVVFCSALEVVRDDARALRHAAGVLRAGGRVVCFVSAVPWVAGSLDRGFRQRRYTRAGLRARLDRAGFSVAEMRYVNLLGLAGMLWDNLVARREEVPEAAYRSRDRLIPWARRLDAWTGPPLGRSLLAVGIRRP